MRFQHHNRYEFKDTPRKRAAFFAKQRRERDEHPLFAEMIADEQAQRGVDEVMKQRAESFAKGEQKDRNFRAKKWREARAKIAAYDEPARSTIREFWNDAPYPANPVYLLGMLRDIERGPIALDKPPPWRPTEEETRIGRDSTSQCVSVIASRPGELE